jgi:hypothetical protein
LAHERATWRARRDAERAALRAAAPPPSSPRPTRGVRPPEPVVHLARPVSTGTRRGGARTPPTSSTATCSPRPTTSSPR